MSAASRLPTVAVLAAVLAGLAGCAPAVPGDVAPSDQTGSEQTETGGSTTAGGCPAPGATDLQPFSSPLVTEPIPDGAVYGDGSELSFTTSLGPDLSPGFELFYLVGDALTSYTAGNWEDADGGKYTTNLNVFNSDLDGQPGYVEVTAFPDGVTFDGERYEGDLLVLGLYCITYAVE